MIQKILCLIFAVMILIVVSESMADSERERGAETAALNWLALVDGGRYSDSWNEAALFLKTAVKKEQLELSLQTVRKPLGKLISREVKSKVYKTSLPGAPDGQYVIIKFQTSFENKSSAIETVTPMLDKDGTWRVSGYYIN